jgi:hypothetical protein
MTKTRSLFAAGILALSVAASPALALSARTFVSGTGSDSSACGLATPCRTFAYALAQTAASGEIIVLSSAGYGPVTITQSVSIINTSNFAGVTVGSGNGITINAGTSDSVVLRGLTIDGGGAGSNGIVLNSGGKLTIDQCDVMNFVGTGAAGNGVLIQPTSGNSNILVTNTTASNNKWAGIYFLPLQSVSIAIVIDRVSANNNSYGIVVNSFNTSSPAMASISNSIASFNSQDGFYFQDGPSSLNASLDASNASSNGHSGVYNIEATLVLGRSQLMNNSQYGLLTFGDGTSNSYKDNRIAGNGTSISGLGNGTATLY